MECSRLAGRGDLHCRGVASLPKRASVCRNPLRRLGNEDGTAVVEFAMIAPVLVLLLIGTIDFATAIYDRFALNGAVSAAADYAILNASSVNSSTASRLRSRLAISWPALRLRTGPTPPSPSTTGRARRYPVGS